MTTHDDVIVIGGGSPGEHAAGAPAEGGLRVAAVERELAGGECSDWACMPSKTLLRQGEAVHGARGAGAAAEVDVEAVPAWRASPSRTTPTPARSAGRPTAGSSWCAAADGSPAPAPCRWTASATRVATSCSPSAPSRSSRPSAACASSTGRGRAARRPALPAMPRRLLGEALGEVLRRDGIELFLGADVTSARCAGEDYVVESDDRRELRGDRLLVAAGRRPRVRGIDLETVRMVPDARGIPVDADMRAGGGLWATGDVTGLWPLTHVGKYPARIAAANVLGERRAESYDAVPRVAFTDPQAAAVGATDDRDIATRGRGARLITSPAHADAAGRAAAHPEPGRTLLMPPSEASGLSQVR